MAFSYSRTDHDAMGRGVVMGTYNAASVTSGTIATGFNTVVYAELSATSASPSKARIVATGGSLAVSGLTTSQTGYFIAIGY